MQPTEKMLAAQKAWRTEEEALVKRFHSRDPAVTDQTFFEAISKIALEHGINWCLEWDDEMVVTWKDGDIMMWSDDVRWLESHRAKVEA